jgi:hypothetical protein
MNDTSIYQLQIVEDDDWKNFIRRFDINFNHNMQLRSQSSIAFVLRFAIEARGSSLIFFIIAFFADVIIKRKKAIKNASAKKKDE